MEHFDEMEGVKFLVPVDPGWAELNGSLGAEALAETLGLSTQSLEWH